MADDEGKGGGGGGGGASIVLMIIGGGLALAAVAVGILLLISSSHMTMPAKCSPLADPVLVSRIRDSTGECFEFDSDVRVDADLSDKKKDKRCDKEEPDLFRSSVRVEGDACLRCCCSMRLLLFLLRARAVLWTAVCGQFLVDSPLLLFQWSRIETGGVRRFSILRPSSLTLVFFLSLSFSHNGFPSAALHLLPAAVDPAASSCICTRT
jgi:hypothetical protein